MLSKGKTAEQQNCTYPPLCQQDTVTQLSHRSIITGTMLSYCIALPMHNDTCGKDIRYL